MLEEAGYQQYEVSGYSKPDYQCQHNLTYWRFGDYLGIGCGAHGKLSFEDGRIVRTTKVKHPRGYLNMLKPYLDSETHVEADERPFEFFINRLRLLEACPKSEFTERTGLPLDAIRTPMNYCIENGYIDDLEHSWIVTEKGKLFLNDVLEQFELE